MRYSLNLADDGRILSATYEKYSSDGVLVDALPEGDISDYFYKDGKYIYDPLPEYESAELPSTDADMANAILTGVNSI